MALSRPVRPSHALKSGPPPSPSVGSIAAPEGPDGPLSPVAPDAPLAPLAPLVPDAPLAPVPCVTDRCGPRGWRSDGPADARDPSATTATAARTIAFHEVHQARIQEVSAPGLPRYMGRSGYSVPARPRIRPSD